ncbi:putative lipoprotein [Desulfatibacillum aliphaticivorans]|uniref:Lipoprotein n=1 Tax=Desulfatibacillum aliphaticivorans TaxID=218208 RepID=B8FMW0_DESAL|nr:DUF6694 family lipoprotein [Desulfatibacillum aliphaticivorans]ACL05830.1 putative lipoprotein [Desulfatibacillum aliphaticivorans]
MKRLFTLLVVLMLATFTACGGGPEIDGSSDEAFKNSITEVRNSLEPEKASEFDKALMVIGFKSMGNVMSSMKSPEDMMAKMKKDLDGKNAEQVMKMAKEIREESKKK